MILILRFCSLLVLLGVRCSYNMGLGPVLFSLYTQPLDHIFEKHEIPHHFFPDDSQLYNSSPPEQIDSLLSSVSSCISEIQTG
jgi:hypothetical protein